MADDEARAWARVELQRLRSGPRPGGGDTREAVQQQMLDRLFAFAMEVLFWWHEVGEQFYGRRAGPGCIDEHGAAYQYDEGLRGIAADAVRVLGGWRRARAILRGLREHGDAQVRARAVRGIRVRE